jgi:hypothetical protein
MLIKQKILVGMLTFGISISALSDNIHKSVTTTIDDVLQVEIKNYKNDSDWILLADFYNSHSIYMSPSKAFTMYNYISSHNNYGLYMSGKMLANGVGIYKDLLSGRIRLENVKGKYRYKARFALAESLITTGEFIDAIGFLKEVNTGKSLNLAAFAYERINDRKNQEEMLLKSHKKGNDESSLKLAELVFNESPEVSIQIAKDSLDRGNLNVLEFLGDAHMNIDLKTATKYYLDGYLNNHVESAKKALTILDLDQNSENFGDNNKLRRQIHKFLNYNTNEQFKTPI